MAVRIVSRVLPGRGVSQELTLHDDRTVAVVTRHDGARDLIVGDADGGTVDLTLAEDEADAVAELLGSPKIVSRLASLQSLADALLVEQLPIPHHSPYAGRPLGEIGTRTRTRASIVAVTRGGATQPAPGPDFELEAGDLVVVVGTREGLDQIGHLLDGTG